MLNRLINQLWLKSRTRHLTELKIACAHPEQAQQELLQKILRSASQSIFGKQYQFKNIDTIAKYQTRIPQTEESTLQTYIEAIASGQSNVLFSGLPLRFEETSGSTSAARLIPFTKSLSDAFDRAIGAWLVSLQKQYPAAFYGKAYWSLSPATKSIRYSVGGIRIGSLDDSEYFSPIMRWLIHHIMAVRPDTGRILDAENFYYSSACQLLNADDLSLVSIWSPTFLLQLDIFIRRNMTQILSDPHSGLSKRRCEYLSNFTNFNWQWSDIWPALKLVSVWTHAQAAQYIQELENILGPVAIQGKGLLSTEAVVSIPIDSRQDPVLALNSTFIEGREITDKIMLPAHAWKIGKIYQVYITTQAGLYRYSTGDVVEVTGMYYNNPCIRFLGRSSRSSDLVGEKLSEHQALAAYSGAQQSIEQSARNYTQPAILVACLKCNHAIYNLYGPQFNKLTTRQIQKFQNTLLEYLAHNPYFKQALDLAQIQSVNLQPISQDTFQAMTNYLKESRQIQDGDFKLPFLIQAEELPTEFVNNN